MSDSNVEPILPPIDAEAFDLAVSIAKRLKAELSWPSKDVWANSFDIVQDVASLHEVHRRPIGSHPGRRIRHPHDNPAVYPHVAGRFGGIWFRQAVS